MGDILCALKTLPWSSDEQARGIVESLGFTLKQTAVDEKPKQIGDNQRYPSSLEKKKAQKSPPPNWASPPQPRPLLELPHGIVKTALNPITEEQVAPPPLDPDWLNAHNARLPAKPVEAINPVSRHSLFSNNTSRGILGAVVATRRQGRQVDVRTLIDQAVSGHLPHQLPYLAEATLAQGCQLLLHFSERMVPWWDDLKILGQQLQHVVGEQPVNLFEFDQQANRAQRWEPPNNFVDWAPEPGVPVLVATDLGIPNHCHAEAIKADWLPLIQRCQTARAPLLLLIPWPRSMHPKELGNYPQLIHWNPHTSAAMVRRIIGPGHQVEP